MWRIVGGLVVLDISNVLSDSFLKGWRVQANILHNHIDSDKWKSRNCDPIMVS